MMDRVDHLLFMVAEECAEVAQRASKAARFGLAECQPGQPHNNAERMLLEFGDLMTIMEMLRESSPVVLDADTSLRAKVDETIKAKWEKVEKYLKYSAEMGRLKGEA